MALHFDGFHGRFSNITAAEGSGGADACDGPKSATKAAEKVDAVNSSSLEDSLRDLLSDDEADEMPCEADRHSAEAKPAAVSLQVSVATPAAATPRRMFRTDSSLSNMSCATDDATPPNSARPVRALGARKGFEGNFKWGGNAAGVADGGAGVHERVPTVASHAARGRAVELLLAAALDARGVHAQAPGGARPHRRVDGVPGLAQAEGVAGVRGAADRVGLAAGAAVTGLAERGGAGAVQAGHAPPLAGHAGGAGTLTEAGGGAGHAEADQAALVAALR
eukprot:3243259-Rhodomonas_salina.1